MMAISAMVIHDAASGIACGLVELPSGMHGMVMRSTVHVGHAATTQLLRDIGYSCPSKHASTQQRRARYMH